MTHIKHYEDLNPLALYQVRKTIQGLKPISLEKLRLMDLVLFNDRAVKTGNGVYCLFRLESGNCVYVGKASSRSFIERIPLHLDPRKEAWMNSLLQKISKNSECTLEEALLQCRELGVCLINVKDKQNKGLIGAIESALKIILEPQLTPPGRTLKLKAEEKHGMILKDLVEMVSTKGAIGRQKIRRR